ncbi:MAG TPA: zf-HC2 domain-containing protein [Gemmatimonadales bacterium]
MRHVPDEELHAYLDQALSRSQCIEIETHLAACGACRHQRDAVAALRDRTTAVLAQGALQRRPRSAPYSTLVEQAGRRRQAGWRRYGVWAASIAGAVLAGWGMRAVLDPHVGDREPQLVVAEQPAAASSIVAAEPEAPPPEPAIVPNPAGRFVDPSLRLVGGGRPPRGPAPDAEPAAAEPEVADGWSPVSLPQAAEATGNLVATLPDLPVEAIRLRPVGELERPLVEVTQRRPDGELLITIEGPVAEVVSVVSDHRLRGLNSSTPSRSLPDYLDEDGAPRRTSRVVTVIGKLPADSLNALAQAVVVR